MPEIGDRRDDACPECRRRGESGALEYMHASNSPANQGLGRALGQSLPPLTPGRLWRCTNGKCSYHEGYTPDLVG
jgi:hypothetical protein